MAKRPLLKMVSFFKKINAYELRCNISVINIHTDKKYFVEWCQIVNFAELNSINGR